MSEVVVKLSVKGEVAHGAAMYVVGDCPQLGQWKALQAVLLEQQQDTDCETESLWKGCIKLPRNTEISFRFFIGKTTPVMVGTENGFAKVIEVISWETNIQPRCIVTPDTDEYEVPLADFGSYANAHTLSHGWLENQQCIQVRFHDNPLFMWKSKHREQVYSIKCTPVNYEPGVDERVRSQEIPGWSDSDSCSMEGPPLCDRTAMVYYNLNQYDLTPQSQPATGCVYHKDDYLVFMARGFNQKHLGFQVDIFVHEKGKDPRFIGSAHLLPPTVDTTIFSKRVPIVGLKHRPIGEVQVEIFRITPMVGYEWKMDVSYQNHWKWPKGQTLNVGHRGMGSSYKRVANMKENTVSSLYAAAQQGADFVEFDVLLTKDLVPVIYHDFSVCLSTAHKDSSASAKALLEVAVKDLSLSHLQSMKLYHPSSGPGAKIEMTEDNEEDQDHQPFPTLQRCLEKVDPRVGFNIEIKYPQLIETGESEMDNYFDLNPYVDRILDVVFKCAGDRKIIFSTFHADCCIMVNLKQNKYPVLFLSNGPTERYTPYSDWRCSTFEHGINFAKAESLLGVNFQAEGLVHKLELIPYIHSLGLVLFAWGDDLNEHEVKQTLRKHEVDAIIFDRIGYPHPNSFVVTEASLDLITDGSSGVVKPGSSTEDQASSIVPRESSV